MFCISHYKWCFGTSTRRLSPSSMKSSRRSSTSQNKSSATAFSSRCFPWCRCLQRVPLITTPRWQRAILGRWCVLLCNSEDSRLYGKPFARIWNRKRHRLIYFSATYRYIWSSNIICINLASEAYLKHYLDIPEYYLASLWTISIIGVPITY